ncbi:Zeamatin [Hordeum vulgare]|nr:Zeamatin [Hordeum vulgare]
MSAASALFLFVLVITGEAATLRITNQCSYTVWPAVVPGGGRQLDPGEAWVLDVPAGNTSGRVWARTACTFHGEGNVSSCQTGDCGGLLACTAYGRPPSTLGEFAFGGLNAVVSFDISVMDGFNVPMDFLPVPVQGRAGCVKGPRCPANITSQCPTELKASGGCNSACRVLKQDKYCCTGSAAHNCSTTNYSVFFKKMCPDAYSYPKDDPSSTFSCPTGTNYQVVFCPLMNQAMSPPAESPVALPAPIGPTSMKPKSSTVTRVVTILAPVGSFILLTVVFLLAYFICKRRTHRQHEMEEEEEFGELQGTPIRFTYQQLKAATEQFADKLGEGGFGSVFKGKFGDEMIAVKRLDRAGQGKREFSAEVQTIGRIHHINLVSLIGFCAEKSYRDMSQVVTRMRGTPGYLAPEWLTSQITEKADVYSFGVVVMEIVSGRKNLDTSRSEESIHLITLLEEKVKHNHLVELIDKNSNTWKKRLTSTALVLWSWKSSAEERTSTLPGCNSDDEARMWCLQIDCQRRPKMSEVVKVLEGAMSADNNIDHNFVVARNVISSVPPLSSHVSGPN